MFLFRSRPKQCPLCGARVASFKCERRTWGKSVTAVFECGTTQQTQGGSGVDGECVRRRIKDEVRWHFADRYRSDMMRQLAAPHYVTAAEARRIAHAAIEADVRESAIKASVRAWRASCHTEAT